MFYNSYFAKGNKGLSVSVVFLHPVAIFSSFGSGLSSSSGTACDDI